ncbi:hypothetical protein V6N13_025029 [Hibiscus sabdariffa]|uniref:Uncharacterized protein n=1 Tax=Hibiscus sabdariffa TaxID=183260 RepID=A0ABR2A845_9ROSI
MEVYGQQSWLNRQKGVSNHNRAGQASVRVGNTQTKSDLLPSTTEKGGGNIFTPSLISVLPCANTSPDITSNIVLWILFSQRNPDHTRVPSFVE